MFTKVFFNVMLIVLAILFVIVIGSKITDIKLIPTCRPCPW